MCVCFTKLTPFANFGWIMHLTNYAVPAAGDGWDAAAAPPPQAATTTESNWA